MFVLAELRSDLHSDCFSGLDFSIWNGWLRWCRFFRLEHLRKCNFHSCFMQQSCQKFINQRTLPRCPTILPVCPRPCTIWQLLQGNFFVVPTMWTMVWQVDAVSYFPRAPLQAVRENHHHSSVWYKKTLRTIHTKSVFIRISSSPTHERIEWDAFVARRMKENNKGSWKKTEAGGSRKVCRALPWGQYNFLNWMTVLNDFVCVNPKSRSALGGY